MAKIRNYVGLEFIKRLDQRLGGLYGKHIRACESMSWRIKGRPHWMLALDVITNLDDILDNIYHDRLMDIYSGESAPGITVEDGKTINVVISHCLECPFAFGTFCPMGEQYWVIDETEWEASGYLIPAWCPLQSKTGDTT